MIDKKDNPHKHITNTRARKGGNNRKRQDREQPFNYVNELLSNVAYTFEQYGM